MTSRKKVRPAQVNASLPSRSFWKKPFVWLFGAVGALALLLTQINTILSNARQLPGEWGETVDQFSSWYHEDAAWNGRWTNNPEGYVDLADMNLSSDDVEIRLFVEHGEIEGIIATKAICDRVPFVDFVLLRGDVSGGKIANIIAWDIFGGHATDIAKLKLIRDGIIMNVTFEEGANQLFPAKATIALDPSLDPKKVFEPSNQGEEFCKGKTERTTKGIREAVDKLRHTTHKGGS